MSRDAEVRGGERMQKGRSRNWDQRFDAEKFEEVRNLGNPKS